MTVLCFRPRFLALSLLVLAVVALIALHDPDRSTSSPVVALNTDMAALRVLTVAPITKHTATVIFVHGLGDSGHGWKPVAEMLQDNPELHHVKWVLPNARVVVKPAT